MKLKRYSLDALDKYILASLNLQDQLINDGVDTGGVYDWEYGKETFKHLPDVESLPDCGTYMIVFIPVKTSLKLVQRVNGFNYFSAQRTVLPSDRSSETNTRETAKQSNEESKYYANNYIDINSFATTINLFADVTSEDAIVELAHEKREYVRLRSRFADIFPKTILPRDYKLYLRSLKNKYSGNVCFFGLNAEAVTSPLKYKKSFNPKKDLVWTDTVFFPLSP